MSADEKFRLVLVGDDDWLIQAKRGDRWVTVGSVRSDGPTAEFRFSAVPWHKAMIPTHSADGWMAPTPVAAANAFLAARFGDQARITASTHRGLHEAAERLDAARNELAAAEEALREAVFDAMSNGDTAAMIADVLDLTPQRVYQIRDGRR